MSQWVESEATGSSGKVGSLQEISEGEHTNDTGGPIKVYVDSEYVNSTIKAKSSIRVLVNGTEIYNVQARNGDQGNRPNSGSTSVSFLVPDGADYSIYGDIDKIHFQKLSLG